MPDAVPAARRDSEHHLPVRHGREERGVQPLRPDREALGAATGTDVATLAGEREQILVRAGIAADAGEVVLEHATGEEPVRHLRDDGPPRAVLAREAIVVDRLQPMQAIRHTNRKSGDARGRRGW